MLMKPKLTKEIAYEEIRDFFNKNTNPMIIFGSGMSCAIDRDFGMSKLKEVLKTNKRLNNLIEPAQQKQWDNVIKELDSNNDLESALNNASDEKLIKIIKKVTAGFISQIDYQYALKILNRKLEWPAIKIVKRVLDKLSPSDVSLSIATTNYDMLAEYSFEIEALPYINGFVGSLLKKINWKEARKSMEHQVIRTSKQNKKPKTTKQKQHIEFFKVHGSLNTFLFNDEIVEMNSLLHKLPKNIERFIITPGISKYKNAMVYRDELFHQFDEVVKKKNAFIFLGYGFHDSHFEKNIMDKILLNNSSAICITQDINPQIMNICTKSENFWVICKNDSLNKSKIFNKKYSNWLYLDNDIWNINKFCEEILGDKA